MTFFSFCPMFCMKACSILVFLYFLSDHFSEGLAILHAWVNNTESVWSHISRTYHFFTFCKRKSLFCFFFPHVPMIREILNEMKGLLTAPSWKWHPLSKKVLSAELFEVLWVGIAQLLWFNCTFYMFFNTVLLVWAFPSDYIKCSGLL